MGFVGGQIFSEASKRVFVVPLNITTHSLLPHSNLVLQNILTYIGTKIKTKHSEQPYKLTDSKIKNDILCVSNYNNLYVHICFYNYCMLYFVLVSRIISGHDGCGIYVV